MIIMLSTQGFGIQEVRDGSNWEGMERFCNYMAKHIQTSSCDTTAAGGTVLVSPAPCTVIVGLFRDRRYHNNRHDECSM